MISKGANTVAVGIRSKKWAQYGSLVVKILSLHVPGSYMVAGSHAGCFFTLLPAPFFCAEKAVKGSPKS